MNAELNPKRYSCHECREDAELVMSDRASQAVRGLYDAHLRECRDCRKMHRLLYALYEGPVVPPPPTGLSEEKEFHAALRRSREELPEPWYHKWSLRAGITAMAGAAAALTVALFQPTPSETPAGSGELGAAPRVAAADPAAPGGIDHPAQSYGRVLGGNAAVSTVGTTDDAAQANTDTFPVGTRFEVRADAALQVGMVGKIVASFAPGSDVEWTQATPSLLELQVHRGIAAVRYDRRPSDPILYVRTPTAVVRVIGTVFTVEVDEANAAIFRDQVAQQDAEDVGVEVGQHRLTRIGRRRHPAIPDLLRILEPAVLPDHFAGQSPRCPDVSEELHQRRIRRIVARGLHRPATDR